jgi:glycosyltransferase involved in cell wall biosynthesis
VSSCVSFLLPVKDASSELLNESIRSVVAQGQLLPDWECVIVDDSDPSIRAVNLIDDRLKTQRIKFLNGDMKGLSSALNKGLKNCKFEFVARVDVDDAYPENRALLQQAFLQCHPQVSVVGGQLLIQRFDRTGLVTEFVRKFPQRHHFIFLVNFLKAGLPHPGVMYRKSDVLDAGGYNETLKRSEDIELWLKMARRGFIFANLSDIVCVHNAPTLIRKDPLHWSEGLRARWLNITPQTLVLILVSSVVLSGLFIFTKVEAIAKASLWKFKP